MNDPAQDTKKSGKSSEHGGNQPLLEFMNWHKEGDRNENDPVEEESNEILGGYGSTVQREYLHLLKGDHKPCWEGVRHIVELGNDRGKNHTYCLTTEIGVNPSLVVSVTQPKDFCNAYIDDVPRH